MCTSSRATPKRRRTPSGRRSTISRTHRTAAPPRSSSLLRVLRGGCDRGEPREAEVALVRCTHRRELVGLVELVRAPRFAPADAAVGEDDQRPLLHLALAQRDAAVALDDLERDPRRGEEDALAALAEPERPP